MRVDVAVAARPRPRRRATRGVAAGISSSASSGDSTLDVEADAAGPARAPLAAPPGSRGWRRSAGCRAVSNTPSSLVQLDAVAAEPHHRRRRVELGDEAGGVAGRAAGQLGLLDQQHVAPARRGQVVGDAAAGDTAADHDDLRAVGPSKLVCTTFSGLTIVVAMPVDKAIDELLDLVPALRGARGRDRARRRPHEHQLQGGHRPRGLRGARLGQGLGHARDRPRERVPKHGRRRRGGRRRGRSSTTSRSVRCWCSSSSRARPRAPRTCAAATSSRWWRGACRRLHGAARFRDDFNMFQIQRRYLDARAGARLPAARPLPRVRAAGAADRACDGRPRRGHRALQQRPAGRELHRRRRASSG